MLPTNRGILPTREKLPPALPPKPVAPSAHERCKRWRRRWHTPRSASHLLQEATTPSASAMPLCKNPPPIAEDQEAPAEPCPNKKQLAGGMLPTSPAGCYPQRGILPTENLPLHLRPGPWPQVQLRGVSGDGGVGTDPNLLAASSKRPPAPLPPPCPSPRIHAHC